MWRGSDDWCGLIVSGTTLEGKRFWAADSRTPSFRTRRDAETWIKKANDVARVPGVSYFLVEDVEDREDAAMERSEDEYLAGWHGCFGSALDEKSSASGKRHEEIMQAEKEYLLERIAQFRQWVQKTAPAREAIRARAEKSDDCLFRYTWTHNFGLCLSCPYFGLQATEDGHCQGECGARPALTKNEGKTIIDLVAAAVLDA